MASFVNAVILNGAKRENDTVSSAGALLRDELSAAGWKVEMFTLRDMDIRHCRGCFECWVRTPGVCTTDDDGRTTARAIVQSDLVVMLGAISFGCYSSELKRALDRLICLILPFFMQIDGETHHPPRYEKNPSLLGVGVLPSPNDESERIFRQLTSRNSINFHSPASCAGVICASQTKREIRSEIRSLLTSVGVKP